MLRTGEILSTIEMLHSEHLDVRTVTLALNVDDCAATSAESLCRKLREKIVRRAASLVQTCDRIGGKYGIPVTNKRLAISPAAKLLAGHGRAAAVQVAHTLDAAAEQCGVDLVGGFTALVQKGITPAGRDRNGIAAGSTQQYAAGVLVGERRDAKSGNQHGRRPPDGRDCSSHCRGDG